MYGILEGLDVIFGRSEKEHEARLDEFLRRLHNANLNDLPVRVHRLRLRLMQFSLTIAYGEIWEIIGCSRLFERKSIAQLFKTTDIQIDTDNYAQKIFSNLPASNSRLDKMSPKQTKGGRCLQIKLFKQKACEIAKIYWTFRKKISFNEDLLTKRNRLFIAISMRDNVLSKEPKIAAMLNSTLSLDVINHFKTILLDMVIVTNLHLTTGRSMHQ
ncbi:hypothetical protein MAR_037706, partial [Mya arenaria]